MQKKVTFTNNPLREANNLDEIAFILDASGFVIDLTPYTLTFCHLTRGDIIGKHFRELIHPDDHKSLSTRIIRCFRQTEPPFQVRLQNYDRRWIEATVKLTALAQNKNIMVNIELSESNSHQLTVSKSSLTSFHAKLSRALVATNGPPSSIKPVLQIVGKTFGALDCYLVETRGPKSWIPVSRWLADTSDNAQMKQHDWSRFDDLYPKLYDGHPFLTDFLVSDVVPGRPTDVDRSRVVCSLVLPIRSTTELVGFLGLDRSYSYGMWNNQEIDILIVVAQQLLIPIMNFRLSRELKRVQGKESLGGIAGSLGQLFNNLLNGLLYHTYELRNMVGGDEECKRQLDQIERAGLFAAEITKQLVGYTVGSSGKKRPLNINNLVDDILPFVGRHSKANIRVELVKDPQLPDITANFDQMRQMVNTLAENAMEALPNGGVLTIQTRTSTYERDTYVGTVRIPAGHYVVLTVSDTGTGMDSATLEKIFDPFFSTKDQNRGLGLASARGIVLSLGGIITAVSKPSEGSTFTVFLPAN